MILNGAILLFILVTFYYEISRLEGIWLTENIGKQHLEDLAVKEQWQ